MRCRALIFALTSMLAACAGRSPTGADREAPIALGTREQIAAARALDCQGNTCTTTDPNCTISFDDAGLLTTLRCDLAGGLLFTCTRPCADAVVCTWSDAPGCADVYTGAGIFVSYVCGEALGRICAVATPDAGGPPPDAAVTNPDCQALDERGCAATTSCHGVYRDDQNCGCAPIGCCTRFDRCADGAAANCQPAADLCERVAPHCEGGFVISYTGAGGCYEGCVHSSDCPTACGPNATFPSFDNRCDSTAACAIGVHQINCCGERAALGINAAETQRFADAAARCDALFPGCGCPSRGTLAEDGRYVFDESTLGVTCTPIGECRTFAR